jgi:molybdate transport system ATP-binding protein
LSEAGLHARLVARVGSLAVDAQLDTGPGTLVLVGPNGAGKSTLLSLLLGARPVEQGRISVAGTVLLDTAQAIDVPLEHRRLGYVPQDYALFPHLSVRENVAFALASQSPRLPRKARDRQVDDMLRELGLDAFAERSVPTLSGGEKQRVALARALVVKPRALLLDEPLAALDVHARHEVRSFLAACLASIGLPAVVVTHDAEEARVLGHRIAVLEAGRISQTGTWQELCARPASRFVERFVATVTRDDALDQSLAKQ